MSAKTTMKATVATGAIVFGLITGATYYFTPHTTAQIEQDRAQQATKQLSSNEAAEARRLRAQGMADGEAYRLQELKPRMVRPRIPFLFGK